MLEKKYKNLKYIHCLPKEFKDDETYPLLIHLHGAGGRGTDLNLLKAAGPLYEIEQGREIPMIVTAPQCYADSWFVIMEQLLDFISSLLSSKNIDHKRVYLSGVSMGGYACWQVAMSMPELFAAIVPVCGGGMYWNAAKLKNIPVWAFHGALDTVVYVTESIHMVNSINKNNGSAKLTIYPDVSHDSWLKAYAEDSLYKWLLNQEKGDEV